MSEEKKLDAFALKTAIVLTMILAAAALRIAPHPWNFTPIGAMALFSGAMLRPKWLKFCFPIAALFAGDLFIGLHKLIPVIYASFLLSVLIGARVEKRRTTARIGVATLLGSAQFFLVTNFAVWAGMSRYRKTLSGLGACYAAGIPFFWNTLAGDAFYVGLLFGGFALAERIIPALREPASGPGY